MRHAILPLLLSPVLACQVQPPAKGPQAPSTRAQNTTKNATKTAPKKDAAPALTSRKLDAGIAAEASGVAIGPKKGPTVVLDNARGALRGDPPQGSLAPTKDGYEGLTFDARSQRYYAVIESLKTPDGPRAQVDTYSADWRLLESHPVDLKLPSRNKGIEGIAHTWAQDTLHLLLLCEAPGCDTDVDSGKGRVHVVTLQDKRWVPVDRIKLPKKLAFRDFSGLDLVGDRLAVTSQETRALWLGRVTQRPRPGESPDWSVEGEGRVIELGELCNLEGVALRGETHALLVTDRRKSSQPESCARLDQSIHTLRLTTP